jgi:hypothetical protein
LVGASPVVKLLFIDKSFMCCPELRPQAPYTWTTLLLPYCFFSAYRLSMNLSLPADVSLDAIA